MKRLKLCLKIREKLDRALQREFSVLTGEMIIELQHVVIQKNIFSGEEMKAFMQKMLQDEKFSPTHEPSPLSANWLNTLADSETKKMNLSSSRKLLSVEKVSNFLKSEENELTSIKSKDDLHSGFNKSDKNSASEKSDFIYSEYGMGKWEEEDSDSHIIITDSGNNKFPNKKRFHRFTSEGDKLNPEDLMHIVDAKSSFDLLYDNTQTSHL